MGYRPPLVVLWFVPLLSVGGTHPVMELLTSLDLLIRMSCHKCEVARATTSCHVPDPLKP